MTKSCDFRQEEKLKKAKDTSKKKYFLHMKDREQESLLDTYPAPLKFLFDSFFDE